MKKELVIIYDTPSEFHTSLIERQNIHYYLKYFDKVRVLYWAKEKNIKSFEKENGQFIFYPYLKPYNSKYSSGLKYMTWIFKTLWQICQLIPKETKLIFMPIMPLWPGFPALFIAKIKRKKIVVRLEAQKMDVLKAEDRTLGVLKILTAVKILVLKIIYFLTLPFYNAVIGISKDLVNQAKEYQAKKSIWIPMSVNLSLFKPRVDPNNKQEIRILSVGQIKERKGFGELIQALQVLKKEKGYTPKLLIIGRVTNARDKTHWQKFQKMAKGLDIEFKGQVGHDQLAKIYTETDIFILASHVEALGIVILEAMASGLPVVATKTSGAKDLIKDNQTGFLVPIKDFLMLKDKIRILLESQDLRKSMGRAGRERIEKIVEMINKNNKELWYSLLK